MNYEIEYLKLKEENERLLQENSKIKTENKNLDQKISKLKLKSNNNLSQKIKEIERVTTEFNDKLEFCVSFLSFLIEERKNKCIPKPGIYGSFVRKIFEYPIALSNFLQQENSDCFGLFGNFCNGDLDFYMTTYNNDGHLNHIINLLNTQLGIYLNTGKCQFRPKFGKFYYDGNISTSEYFNLDLNTTGISYTKRLYFIKDNQSKFYIDITNSVSENCIDFSVNSFFLNSDGINTILNNNSFLKYLYNIHNKTTKILSHSFRRIEDGVWNTSMTRREKVDPLNKSIIFIKKRLLKILEKGYKIEGNYIPNIKFETIEDCSITGISTPYPVIELSCNHQISLMAYMGIIHKGESQFSESIKCPICRGNLSLKLISVQEKNKEVYINSLIYIINSVSEHSKKYIDDTRVVLYQNISQDALNLINENYNIDEDSDTEVLTEED